MNTDTNTITPIIMNYHNNNIINNDIINIINDDDNFLVERWAHIDQRLRELYYGYAQDLEQEQEQEQDQEQDQDASLEIEWETPESPTAHDRLLCQSPIPFNYRPFIEAADQMTNASADTDSTLSLSDGEPNTSRE